MGQTEGTKRCKKLRAMTRLPHIYEIRTKSTSFASEKSGQNEIKTFIYSRSLVDLFLPPFFGHSIHHPSSTWSRHADGERRTGWFGSQQTKHGWQCNPGSRLPRARSNSRMIHFYRAVLGVCVRVGYCGRVWVIVWMSTWQRASRNVCRDNITSEWWQD